MEYLSHLIKMFIQKIDGEFGHLTYSLFAEISKLRLPGTVPA
jgi:hypothetical protein